MSKPAVSFIALLALAAVCRAAGPEPSPKTNALIEPLGKLKDRIVYESFRPETDSWDLMIMNADGSGQRNLTATAGIQETYPQCSPDGQWIAFECTESTATPKRIEIVRPDGTERRKLVDNGRQMCWNADGTRLAYLPHDPVNHAGGLFILDMATGKTTSWRAGKSTFKQVELDGREHDQPIAEFAGMANLTWSHDGKWIACSVGGMGYSQSMVAIEVDGDRVVDFLHQANETTGSILGCRPNFSNDGTRVAWTVCDVSKLFWVDSAPVDFSGPYPKVGAHTHWIRCEVPEEFYHADWSPDGRFIAFSHGVRGNRMKPARYVPGQKAPGWEICVLDTQANPDQYTQLTHDGRSNKEPDWLKAAR